MAPNDQTLHFRFTSDEAPDFCLELQVPASATFLELNDALIKVLDYDPSEMTSFAICDRHWVQMSEVHLFEPPFSDPDKPTYLMEETTLDHFFPHQAKQGTYTFDILGDRLFYMELLPQDSASTTEQGITLHLLEGTPPQQTSDIDALLREDFAIRHRLVVEEGDEGEEYGFDEEEWDLEGYDYTDEP